MLNVNSKNGKFRVWDNERNSYDEVTDWVINNYGFLGRNTCQPGYRRQANEIDFNVSDERYEIEWYTNESDAEGVQVCQGDVFDYNESYWVVVEWVFNGFQLVMHKKKDADVRGLSDGINQGGLESRDIEGMEIVGSAKELKIC